MRSHLDRCSRPETPKHCEDALFVEQADASLIPGQDSLAETHGRIDQSRGNAAPLASWYSANSQNFVRCEDPGFGPVGVA